MEPRKDQEVGKVVIVAYTESHILIQREPPPVPVKVGMRAYFLFLLVVL